MMDSKDFFIEKTKEYYGITDDPNKAGFLLEDGSLLNLAQHNSDHRNIEHDSVGYVFDDHVDKIPKEFSYLIYSKHARDDLQLFRRLCNAIRMSVGDFGYNTMYIELDVGSNYSETQWIVINSIITNERIVNIEYDIHKIDSRIAYNLPGLSHELWMGLKLRTIYNQLKISGA